MKTSTTLLSLSTSALISTVMSAAMDGQTWVRRFGVCPGRDSVQNGGAKGGTDDLLGLIFASVNECEPIPDEQEPAGKVIKICSCRVTELFVDRLHIDCSPICSYFEPRVGFECPIEEAKSMANWKIVNKCKPEDDCVVTKLNHVPPIVSLDPRLAGAHIICGPKASYTPTPAPTRPPSCVGGYAYDNKHYCKCPAPQPVGDRFEVSVCGDATYLLPKDVQPCTGPTTADAPVHSGCPKKGDIAVKHCRNEVISYLTEGKTGDCQAPEDATCEKLHTGAWGCVFPCNCNTVNTCLEKPKCKGEYKKHENGTCILGNNGYPVKTEKNTADVKTDTLPKLAEGKNNKAGDTGTASAVAMTSMAIMATIAGAFILA